MDAFDFSRRCVVVTGAAGAIGAAVTRRFAAAGAHVTGLDLRAGENVVGCDITDEHAVDRALAGIAARHQITDLVHCAGVLSVGDVLTVPAGEIRRVLDVNLMSAFIVAQAAVHGAPGWAAYCAAKAGVSRLVEALAKELGPSGVRVNAVCPGTVDSPMTTEAAGLIAAAAGVGAAQVRLRYEDENPLRRMASPDEVAGICLFLSSPLAGYVNGASIMVDGGDRPG